MIDTEEFLFRYPEFKDFDLQLCLSCITLACLYIHPSEYTNYKEAIFLMTAHLITVRTRQSLDTMSRINASAMGSPGADTFQQLDWKFASGILDTTTYGSTLKSLRKNITRSFFF